MHQYLDKWQLTNPRPLAQTATSHLFRVDYRGEPAVLKLLTPLGVKDESLGARTLAAWNGDGAVRLLAADDQAHLLEWIRGERLSSLVKDGRDAMATQIVGDVVARLHAYQGPLPPGLTPLREYFGSLFRQAHRDPDLAAGAVAAEALLVSNERVCLLHGDLHHDNLLHHPQRGWLAIDPKGVVGEPTFDLACVLLNPVWMPAVVEDGDRLGTMAQSLGQRLALPVGRILQFAFVYACLSVCWSWEDGDDPEPRLRMVRRLTGRA